MPSFINIIPVKKIFFYIALTLTLAGCEDTSPELRNKLEMRTDSIFDVSTESSKITVRIKALPGSLREEDPYPLEENAVLQIAHEGEKYPLLPDGSGNHTVQIDNVLHGKFQIDYIRFEGGLNYESLVEVPATMTLDVSEQSKQLGSGDRLNVGWSFEPSKELVSSETSTYPTLLVTDGFCEFADGSSQNQNQVVEFDFVSAGVVESATSASVDANTVVQQIVPQSNISSVSSCHFNAQLNIYRKIPEQNDIPVIGFGEVLVAINTLLGNNDSSPHSTQVLSNKVLIEYHP